MPTAEDAALPRRGARRAFALALALLALWLAPFGPAQAAGLLIDRALAVVSDAPTFPADTPARELRLPDDWSISQPRSAGPVWYRLRFDWAPAGGAIDSPALYIERACTRVDVDLNGQRVHSDEGTPELATHRCDQPLLLTLPPGLLRADGNLVDIKLVGRPLPRVSARERAAGLSVIRIGTYADLARAHDLHALWYDSLPKAVGIALLLTAVFTFVAGWLPTRKGYLLHYALLSASCALCSMGAWMRHGTLPVEVVEWVLVATLPIIAAFAVLFLMRYAGLRVRAFDAALLAQCVVVPISLALAGQNQLFVLANAWNLLLALEVLLAAAAALQTAWRMQRREFWFMLGLLLVVALSVFSYLAAQQGWLAFSPWWRLAMPLAFFTLGLRMLYVEVHGMRSVESEMRSLIEKRIADASAEAERNFATLAELRVEQVTERERKRIAADLHDDLGAKLLTIVHTSESDRISSLAREALEEMRLSVRGLTGKPVRLADALGDWRAEVVSRLGQANIGAEWQMPNEEPPQTLPARAYVQTTRILREAVSNIIKLSGAARCVVSGRVQDGDFVLMIQDNGHGIPMALDGNLDRGHGMASMKHRAKQLQGQCLVESGPGFGTVIRLTVPL